MNVIVYIIPEDKMAYCEIHKHNSEDHDQSDTDKRLHNCRRPIALHSSTGKIESIKSISAREEAFRIPKIEEYKKFPGHFLAARSRATEPEGDYRALIFEGEICQFHGHNPELLRITFEISKIYLSSYGGYMLSKKRTHDLIISEILRVCEGGAGKTKIVYQANLNFKAAEPYLNNLRRKGYIETFSNGPRTIYKTTPKGLDLKDRFDQFHAELEKLSTCV